MSLMMLVIPEFSPTGNNPSGPPDAIAKTVLPSGRGKKAGLVLEFRFCCGGVMSEDHVARQIDLAGNSGCIDETSIADIHD